MKSNEQENRSQVILHRRKPWPTVASAHIAVVYDDSQGSSREKPRRNAMSSELIFRDGRVHVKSGLMRESLVSKTLNEATAGGLVRRMVPDVSFIAIGGQSIMDRGAEAIMPLVETIVSLRKDHKLV